MKEYVVYTKWIAAALHNQGFKILRIKQNPRKPEFYCWVFEDTLDLHIAIRYLAEKRRQGE